jgi:hypothetical protein
MHDHAARVTHSVIPEGIVEQGTKHTAASLENARFLVDRGKKVTDTTNHVIDQWGELKLAQRRATNNARQRCQAPLHES